MGKRTSQEPFRYEQLNDWTILNGPVYEGLYLNVPHFVTFPVKVGESVIQRVDSAYYFAELLLDSGPVKLYAFFDADGKKPLRRG